MKDNRFDKLMGLIDRLEKARIPYRLSKELEDAIQIQAFAPGEYWEIDFFTGGEIYVERFRSNGHIDDESVLEELFALCSDDEPAPQLAGRNDGSPRK
jgi:hypothetical protein